MKKMDPKDIEHLIASIKSGKEIPIEYKYALFPTRQKEYELVYAGKMRKEDVLADNQESKAVPLQVDKVFSENKYPLAAKNWQNLLIFGDNLQILKTFYRNEDPLIKNKIKGKVKLIYIDPPFSTEEDFKGDRGQKAYRDKTKGAEFIEYLRRRLIVARELLADDGSIYVHLDEKKSHYIKVIMDELFSFQREIVWRIGWVSGYKTAAKNWIRNHDVILFYTKSDSFIFNKEYVSYPDGYLRRDGKEPEGNGMAIEDTWNCNEIDTMHSIQIMSFSDEKTGYPTQKNENILARIIKAATNPGDIVMDFFCGSGTTLAVADKLDRRWIGCDIGKLAIYTTQKRLLELNRSKDVENSKNKYSKPVKSFAVASAGIYDLGKIFRLKKDEYIRFVKDLFEIENTKMQVIGGIRIDGKKRQFYAYIFPYWDLEGVSVDKEYILELHKNIGSRINGRFYIVVPANNVSFISDYYEIGHVKYYFLKVPYQIIKELHEVQFKKWRQPQSKKDINNLDEAVGFHFIRQPEVKSDVKKVKGVLKLKIMKFESGYAKDDTAVKLNNFESLAMLLFDYNYDGKEFIMDYYMFAADIVNKESEEEVHAELLRRNSIDIELSAEKCGKQIMAIYVDIYGNEFREVINMDK